MSETPLLEKYPDVMKKLRGKMHLRVTQSPYKLTTVDIHFLTLDEVQMYAPINSWDKIIEAYNTMMAKFGYENELEDIFPRFKHMQMTPEKMEHLRQDILWRMELTAQNKGMTTDSYLTALFNEAFKNV